MEKKIRVLLVDDEEPFVANVARLLRFRGFHVRTAFNGFEALDAIRSSGEVDVVVLDVKMPGMDGIVALDRIKELAPDTEVIMLTGHATLVSGTEAMRKGAYDYLMKPCDIEDLTEKIREAYESENIRRHPVLWPRKLVREIALHGLVQLRPEDPLQKALQTLTRDIGEEAVEEVYIVDREDRLLGVLSKRDLLNEARRLRPGDAVDWRGLTLNPQWLPEKTLGEIMRHDPVSTPANAYLTDAANQMLLHHVRSVPVIRGGRAIGILKIQDVFHYLDQEVEASEEDE
ncbi:MAG: response regulator [Deltaproteobacteria bacterium]|nr:response regulator [Deltaproteobacteria bacterium]